MIFTLEKFETMCDAIILGGNNRDEVFYRLYLISRSLEIVKPIGWLKGFMDYMSPHLIGDTYPPFTGNPYPYLSLAYVHYMEGRMYAHSSYQQYYNNQVIAWHNTIVC